MKQGVAGPICGSPFTSVCEDGANPQNNIFSGPLMISTIKESTRELKEYSTRTLKGLMKVSPTSIRLTLTISRDYLA